EVLPPTRHRLALPFPSSERGEHQGLWRGIPGELPPGFDHGSNLLRNGDWRFALLRFQSAFVKLSFVGRSVRKKSVARPRFPLQPHHLACSWTTEDPDAHQAKIVHVLNGSNEGKDLFPCHHWLV